MDIKLDTVEPEIKYSPQPKHEEHMVLLVTATLACPLCHQTESCITTSQDIPPAKLPHMDLAKELGGIINRFVAQIAKQRPCEHCGIVSAAPKANRETVLAKLIDVVTVDWIDQRVAELPSLTAERQAANEAFHARVVAERVATHARCGLTTEPARAPS